MPTHRWRKVALRRLVAVVCCACGVALPAQAQFTPFDELESGPRVSAGLATDDIPTPGFTTTEYVPDALANERIADLERQLQELRESIGVLQASGELPPQAPPALELTEPTSYFQAPAAGANPAPKPAVAAPIKYPVINVSGLMQADAVWFNQDPASLAALGDAEDFGGFRRARLGVKGQLAENIGYQMEYDFGFPGRPNFTNVYVELQQLPGVGTWRVGQWKHPIHMEAVWSIRELIFMERSLPFGAFIPFRQIGTGLFNTAFDDHLTWAVSGYRYPTSPFGNDFGDDGYGYAGRTTGLIYNDDSINANVHIGGGFSQNRPSTDRLRFRTNPEVGMANQDFNVAAFPLPFFVDTGNFRSNGYELVDLEFAASIYSALFVSEWMGVNADQQLGLPTVNFHGGYAEFAYVLTGEHRPYNKKNGVFTRVVPTTPFGKGGCGAWELAGRWSYVDLNDQNIQGGRQHDWTFGLNWFPNQYTRFAFNYIHAMVDAPLTGADVNADIFGARAQFDF
ncbi:MAG: porin [Planctomycetaceae bacterium]|nr:porin [Planctomycetaceae bacterium]